MEIERKFLVNGDAWREAAVSRRRLTQAYFAIGEHAQVRVRTSGEQAWITVKGQTPGLAREEVETEVPVAFADGIRAAGLVEGDPVEKERHVVPVDGHLFEVDVFHGANAGLILAEVELDGPDTEHPRPVWLGTEVTDDGRYRNAHLAKHPYGTW